MTNREKLMEELNGLGNAEMYAALMNNRATNAMEFAMCVDCKAMNGGECPVNKKDAPCPFNIAEWLSMPARHVSILRREREATKPGEGFDEEDAQNGRQDEN